MVLLHACDCISTQKSPHRSSEESQTAEHSASQHPAVCLTKGSSVFQIEPGAGIPGTQHHVVHANKSAGTIEYRADDQVRPYGYQHPSLTVLMLFLPLCWDIQAAM
jgi:hypothetical protein